MKLYTLIHVCADEKSLHNSSAKDFDDQIRLYLLCAKKLHDSLKQENLVLSILTNDKEYVLKLLPKNFNVEVIELVFNLQVPSGIKFYSAHFKLEVFKFLSALPEPYVALLDSDILCVNKIPRHLQNIIDLKIPLYYDITDQTAPAYGIKTLIADKEKLSKKKSLGLWAGGEFISGTPSFFQSLYREVERIKDDYFSDFNSFHHQGDEMLTSIAIENLLVNEKLGLINAGSLNIIARFWSVNTLHFQKPIQAYFEHFLLHLPADKKFISDLNDRELKDDVFFEKYSKHLRKRSLRRAISKLIRRQKN